MRRISRLPRLAAGGLPHFTADRDISLDRNCETGR